MKTKHTAILSTRGIQSRTLEQAFIWMLYNAIFGSKWSYIHIISYWFEIAFQRAITPQEKNKPKILHKIRYRLLQKGGINKPILSNSILIQKLTKEILIQIGG